MYEGEEINSKQRNLSQVNVIGLVFGRHKYNAKSVEEMHFGKGGRAHVQEDAVEDGHRDEFENGHHENRETHKQEDAKVGYTLLPIIRLKIVITYKKMNEHISLLPDS